MRSFGGLQRWPCDVKILRRNNNFKCSEMISHYVGEFTEVFRKLTECEFFVESKKLCFSNSNSSNNRSSLDRRRQTLSPIRHEP